MANLANVHHFCTHAHAIIVHNLDDNADYSCMRRVSDEMKLSKSSMTLHDPCYQLAQGEGEAPSKYVEGGGEATHSNIVKGDGAHAAQTCDIFQFCRYPGQARH
jgi:hypothetical protein